MNRLYIAIAAVITLLTVTRCGGNSSNIPADSAEPAASSTGEKTLSTKFPEMEIPSIIDNREQVIEYAATHYWTNFFNTERVSALNTAQIEDSSAILGIDTASVSDALARYLTVVLPQADLSTAGNSL